MDREATSSRLIVLLAAIIVLRSPLRASADGDTLALSLRSNAVSIVTPSEGWGLIVGEDRGQAIIVTADHVVRPPSMLPGDEPSVAVKFYCSQGTLVRAILTEYRKKDFDLAVVTAPLPQGCTWTPDMLGQTASIKRGAEVWFVGRGGAWYVPTSPGRINSEKPDDYSHVEIDITGVWAGTSGGPIVSATGVSGIILGTTENAGTIDGLTIDFIEKAVRDWRLPWTARLREAPPAGDGSLVLISDADAAGAIDGLSIGKLVAEVPKLVSVVLGNHVVTLNAEGLDVPFRNEIRVPGKEQVVAHLGLKAFKAERVYLAAMAAGDSELSAGDPHSAREKYRQAVQAKPGDPRAQAQLAEAEDAAKGKERATARSAFEEAIGRGSYSDAESARGQLKALGALTVPDDARLSSLRARQVGSVKFSIFSRQKVEIRLGNKKVKLDGTDGKRHATLAGLPYGRYTVDAKVEVYKKVYYFNGWDYEKDDTLSCHFVVNVNEPVKDCSFMGEGARTCPDDCD